jgi:peptide/nickel transport system ATP-binding protein/oligopeptide transport system ATP-binding protein
MSMAMATARPAAQTDSAALLEVRDLVVQFPGLAGTVTAVRGVNLTLRAGDSVAVLGESGSGKSVTSRAILGLIESPPAELSGSIRFEGQEILGKSDAELRDIRGAGVAMVFQDSLDSLNPVYTIGAQLTELLRVRLNYSRAEARAEALSLMSQVGIPAPEERIDDYPHQFSGGMRQRICIALAIALRPRLLLADEPTTALDVTVQAGILKLIRRLQAERSMALIFVTHDLAVARAVADRLVVMYAGEVVEEGSIEAVFAKPAHPYSRALLNSHPSAVAHWSLLRPIAGSPPDKSETISGCAFHTRCPRARERCASDKPPLYPVSKDRASRCHYWQEELNA